MGYGIFAKRYCGKGECMLHKRVLVVAFNAKLSDGCDYATQTISLLGKKNTVYAFLLGEPITWKQVFLGKKMPILSRAYNSTLIRPVFILPGRRFSPVVFLNVFLNACILRAILFLRHPQEKKILWFFEPWNILPLYHACIGYTTVYDCVDYFASVGLESWRNEQWLIRHASVVTCVSAPLASVLSRIRSDIHVVPLGCTIFAETHKTIVQIPRGKGPVIGFVGGINYRLDYPLLFQLVSRMPDARFAFVGPIQYGLVSDERGLAEKIARLFSFSNVTHISEVPKDTIYSYMRTFNVGIIPYDISLPFNRFSFPMKSMEYISAGLPVVSNAISSLLPFADNIRIAYGVTGWVTALHGAYQHKKSIQKKRMTVIRTHTWEEKVDAISAILTQYGKASKMRSRQ